MEGVPRIPMMSFPMRRSADTPQFKARLKGFISNHYNEDPESYANEIHELESLRASAVHVSKDYSGCSTLKKYFCQLNFLKSRFPMNEGGTCAVSFSWYDAFSENVHGWSDVDFEMSCVLYNIGALHSELGALDNRQTTEGMKTSCTHFQCAAWAFSHLRHNYQKFFTPDVSPDMLNILMNVCLAQAQECILEKSLIDNRKSTITAKVALQIVEYYSTALRIIDGMLKDSAQYSDKLIKAVKKCRKLVELKVQYYGCIAYLYRGLQAEDQCKWGERITMYKAATEKLNECLKLGKNMEKTDPVHDTLHFTLDVVGGKVAIAEKENEFIYHEKVPELETVMSDVKAVSLVKGIQFKFDDPQVAGADIFGRLVPMEAHEASSLYSEEKAKILRTYSRKIEEKNETLDKFIIPLQLDQLEVHDSDKIPQELIDCCAALSVNQDAVKRLSDLMAKLSSLFHDVECSLEEIEDMLEEQEKKEKEYQEIVGKRPPNNIINELSRELQKYRSAQSVAAESNKTLHEAMVVHVANLNILMKPLDEVLKHVPKYDELEKNEDALERMKLLSSKVAEMRKQREVYESKLRDSILNDDITKSLVVKKGEDLDSVFKDELQKHDEITQVLDQNLLAQENIIRALTEANAEYAETRRETVELKKKRDKVIQSFLSSYEAYDELVAKCNKGIEFYIKLNANVEKLLQRVKSVRQVQNEERETNMERIIRKAIPKTQNTGGYNNPIPTYPPSTVYQTPAVPNAYPTPSPTVPGAGRSSGGHLKLKDYLAMKKEGQTTAELAASMAMTSNTPSPSSFDPSGQHANPMLSSTPPPTNTSVQQVDTTYNPSYTTNEAANIGIRPAPVGSEDAGKGSTCNYSYPHSTAHPLYNNYTSPTVGPGIGYTGYSPNSSPATTVHASSYYGQQVTPNLPTGAPEYTHPNPQITSNYQQPQLPQNPVSAAVPPPVGHPHVAGYSTPSATAPAPPAPPSSYAVNQPSPYIQGSSMNTVGHPSGHYTSQAVMGGVSEVGNTPTAYGSQYGGPMSYAGSNYSSNTNSTTVPQLPPSSQQYPSPVPTPPIVQPAAQLPVQNQNPNHQNITAPHFTSAYHPTANTATKATYTTGTTATPSAGSTVPQPQQSSAVSNLPPTQQQPSVPSDGNSSYSQTSFLAQYVRQNQGYLSNISTQQPGNTTFPSSVNYGSDSTSTYNPQHGGYSQTSTTTQYGQYQQPIQFSNQNQQWQQQGQQPQPQDSTYPATSYSTQATYPSQQQQYQYDPPAQQQQGYPQQAPTSYYSNSDPSSGSQPHYAGTYQQTVGSQPSVPVPQIKSAVGNSNLDLLSDVDFHALPSVEPLAPVVVPASSQGVPTDNVTNVPDQETQVSSSAASLSSLSSLSTNQLTNPLTTTTTTTSTVQIPSLSISYNKVSERKGHSSVDPFQDQLALEKFTFEVEKFENTVEGLARKSLNGPMLRLDLKWKELLDLQNATSANRCISVARCYPMKNRFPDIMPYDQTRVPIPNTKDDYINASFINDLSPTSYPLIATQAPLPSTVADFWHMIWQHYIELVVCLCSDIDLKENIYWPKEKSSTLEYGVLKIVLQTKNNKSNCVERILSVSHRDLKQSRVVVHLQFTEWTGQTFPVSPGPLVVFIKEVATYYQQQRNLSHPVVVHCVPGVGKTGVFCVLSAAMTEIDCGHGIPDVLQIAGTASEQRKGIMNDKQYLRFAYHCLLYYCQDILMKRGILSAKPTFEEKPKKSHIRHPSQDFLQDISLTKLLDKASSSESPPTSSKEDSTSSNTSSVKPSPVHVQQSPIGEKDPTVKPKLSYSDVPESLTNIDPVTFLLQSTKNSAEDIINSKRISFESNKGALFDRTEENNVDPLSSLDPLWNLKNK